MNTHTVHLLDENHFWLEEELKQGNYIDRSDLFEQALNMLRIKTKKINAAKSVLHQNIGIAHTQSQNNEFSHRDIESISKGSQLCSIDNVAQEYQLTRLADDNIENIFTCKLTMSGMTTAQEFLQKLQAACTGLSKIKAPMKLNNLMPSEDDIYYSKVNDVYIIFSKNGDKVNILTAYQTLITFEARQKRLIGRRT